ncbi:PHP domain-containing protein [Sinomonas sp. ASV322]|uniref:helix-hairpin-helix domain-containing protein n=1 Tax=Sinomonas sp. ASV322 TaxID=3041920 RepID=UPI0027DE271C|nr:PHP domain-containing protein [Sinomonas sp. ASV322]MDQ4501170.1 PHP domain-containing protein [Sinomonas sp. ASV322]
MPEPFTHLHVASAFSSFGGGSRPDDFVAAAAADGATALARTDRDGLYGAVRHIGACLAAGIDPIVGVDLPILAEPAEVHAEEDDDGARRGARRPRRGSRGVAGRVVVLAHGSNGGAGWRALCRLVSDAHAATKATRNGPVPVGVLRSELAARCVDPDTGRPVLTVLIGPDSDVGRALSGQRFLRPRTLFREWLDVMPAGALAVELVTQLTGPGRPLSTAHAVRMLRLASEHSIPAVLTNAVRHVDEAAAESARPDAPRGEAARADMARAQAAAVLAAVRAPMPPGEASDVATGHSWLKPAALMHRLGREIVHAAGLGAKDLANLLGNTERIADRCRLDPAADAGWRRPVVPEASVLGVTGEPIRVLAERCRAAVPDRYPGAVGDTDDRVAARLEHELGVIDGLGVAPYFLAVAELAETIRGMGVRSAVQGSGASSVVNYVLGISHVDPLRHRLSFEEFLPRDGRTLPRIGFAVEHAACLTVHRQVFKRFGAERVALVGGPGSILQEAELRAVAPHAGQEGQLELSVDATEVLDQQSRLLSMHPGGLILGDARLLDRTPVQPSGRGLPMSQFDRHDLDSMGLLTLGIHGAPLQSTMAFAVREIARIRGGSAAGPEGAHEDARIDLDAIPLDDEPTYELIRSTHTLGGRPVESPGRRTAAGSTAPRDFNDLITAVGSSRAHGATSALPAYQSAWLATHHPEAFLAGMFEHRSGTYPRSLLVAEARRLGIPILPPDTNESRDGYCVERIDSGPDAGKLGIRPALRDIHGLSRNDLRRIVAGQPYTSIADLLDRARPSRASVRRLAQAGAFDSLHRAAVSRGSGADLVEQLAPPAPPSSHWGTSIDGQLTLDIAEAEVPNRPGVPPSSVPAA